MIGVATDRQTFALDSRKRMPGVGYRVQCIHQGESRRLCSNRCRELVNASRTSNWLEPVAMMIRADLWLEWLFGSIPQPIFQNTLLTRDDPWQ